MKSTPFLTSLLLATAITAQATTPAEVGKAPSEVIAEVGDQAITFGELNTMLNSSAVVGLSLPALGTPERDTVRITLLDKMISANLIYLDALDQGLDRRQDYRSKIDRFSRAMLANLYYRHEFVAPIHVSEQEIEDYYTQSGRDKASLDTAGRAQIEAKLRRDRLQARKSALMQQLRTDVTVKVYPHNLELEGDSERSADTPLARVDDEIITWGEAGNALIAAGQAAIRRNPLAMEDTVRMNALENLINKRILAQRARDMNLDRDPVYLDRLQEYAKTTLINLHRAHLAEEFAPDAETLEAYYQDNRYALMVPAARKVQEVVLGSREAAESIKAKIEQGEITMWQAAAEHSIAPGAKNTLGEIGWVKQNHALPAIDEVIFSLKPDQIGGPVKSPVGWHLVRIMDVRNARYDTLEDPATRHRARRAYIHDKINDYVINLRKHKFVVTFYEDRMIRLAQNEADTVEKLALQSQQEDSITRQRLVEFQRLMNGQER